MKPTLTRTLLRAAGALAIAAILAGCYFRGGDGVSPQVFEERMARTEQRISELERRTGAPGAVTAPSTGLSTEARVRIRRLEEEVRRLEEENARLAAELARVQQAEAPAEDPATQ